MKIFEVKNVSLMKNKYSNWIMKSRPPFVEEN